MGGRQSHVVGKANYMGVWAGVRYYVEFNENNPNNLRNITNGSFGFFQMSQPFFRYHIPPGALFELMKYQAV